MKRFLLVLTVALFCTAVLGDTAFAGMKFGVRQHSFHNSILPSDRTLGAYVGFAAGTSIDLLAGIDHWSYKLSTNASLSDLGASSSEISVKAGSSMLHGGVKFYFAEQEKGKAVSYLCGEFFYGFGTASVSASGFSTSLDPIKDLLSPYGFTAGFGAEFFAADNFSVGGEVGMRYAITKVKGGGDLLSLIDLSNLSLGKSVATAADDDMEMKITSMVIYTGITMNFSF